MYLSLYIYYRYSQIVYYSILNIIYICAYPLDHLGLSSINQCHDGPDAWLDPKAHQGFPLRGVAWARFAPEKPEKEGKSLGFTLWRWWFGPGKTLETHGKNGQIIEKLLR